MRAKLNTYEAILPFKSLQLNKSFKTGEQIKAPASLGREWVKNKTAKQVKS